MKVTAALMLLFTFCNTAYSQFTYTRDVKDSALTVYPYDMIVTNADNCIVATTPPDYTSSHGIYITKLNNRGNLVWSKNYTFFKAFFSTTEKLYNADNDEFLCAVRTDEVAFGGDLLFKADSNGNILWAKRIRPAEKGYLTSPYGVVYTKDKSIYVINDISALGLSILKINSAGKPEWSKFLKIDSTNVFALLVYVAAAADNGLILSTTSSKNFQDNYNHIFKISKDGNAEYEYTTNQASDDYIYAYAAKAGNDGRLNVLFSQYNHYLYSILNLSTGQAETYRIGSSIFDIQSFLRNNNVNVFKGVTFPYVGFQDAILEDAFTKKWNLIQIIPIAYTRSKRAVRIQLYDSLGRICPDYKILDTQRVNEKVAFKFTKSSFKFSPSPVELNVVDTVVSVQDIDTITKVCAGVPPTIQQSFAANQSTKNNDFEIKVFPNPTSSFVNIFINSLSTYTSLVEISDVHGKILKTQLQQILKGENNIKINLNEFVQGIYFLKISIPDRTINQKIIKQ